MEISRYASRLAPNSAVLPSGRPHPPTKSEAGFAKRIGLLPEIPLKSALELPQEPEDARLTGGTRSLARRLLALNIPGIQAPMARTAKAVSLKKQKARNVLLAGSDLVPQDA